MYAASAMQPADAAACHEGLKTQLAEWDISPGILVQPTHPGPTEVLSASEAALEVIGGRF